jgi:hypothetical protein
MLALGMVTTAGTAGAMALGIALLTPVGVSGSARAGADSAARARRFMVGLEGVGMQVPTLKTPIATVDPRFVGSTTTLGGVGLFGRFRPRPIVGVDLGVRSGSVRYKGEEDDDVMSQDLLAVDAGVLLYLAHGEVGQLALGAGMGGLCHRVRYEFDDRRGTQTFGSGLVRLGADAEFLVKRVAFVLSLRSYGVFTARDNVANRGAIMRDASENARRAPVETLQTFVVASAGVAYRF